MVSNLSVMQRPWISTNLAISVDGKISTAAGRPSGWTSDADRRRLHQLRRGADALLVGRRTLLADRMTLTAPGDIPPLRCIASRGGNIPADHPLFHTDGGEIHLLAAPEADPDLPAGVVMHRGGLADFLERLATGFGVGRLHCEGGGGLIRMLAELDAIDEFHLTVAAHSLFGGRDAATATGIPGDFLASSLAFRLDGFEPVAGSDECFLSYRRVQ